jgi:dolichol-phosphate mannosyltransferase
MRILTIVATYSEAANIGRLIPEILRHVPSSAVLVVDDNSPDGTGDVVRGLQAADDRVLLLTRTSQRGYGHAMIAGLQHGIRGGYDVIATLDGDFSHDPTDLPRLIDALGSADVAIGSRYIGGIRVLNWDVRRLLLSLGANAYVRFLTGLECVDCTSGFRAYRVSALQHVPLQNIASTGYAFLPELLFALGNVRVAEVPVCYTERRIGQSKMRKRVIAEAVLRPWMLLCRRLVRSKARTDTSASTLSAEAVRRAEPALPPSASPRPDAGP